MINALDLVLTEQWAMQEEALKRFLEVAETRGGSFDRDSLPSWCTWGERAAEYEAVHLRGGTRLEGSQRAVVRDGVAIIPVFGPIFRRANMMTEMSGAASLELVARDLGVAAQADNVKAILLEIDSPGGQVAGISELAGLIARLKEQKPVCAFIGGTGASAAYWLAAACSGIAASSTAIVGSIGCLGGYRKTDDGTVTVVSSQSPRKNPDPDTEEGRADLQATIDALASVFVADVARYRGVTEQTVLSDFGQGGVLVGRAALKAGMVDRISSLEATVRSLARNPSNLARGARAEDEMTDDTILGAAPAAKPFEEELEALLAGVRGSIDRARDIQSKRLEEGRSLSIARRDQLAAVRDELNTLLHETEPRASEADRLRLAAEAQAIEAEMLAASLLGASI